MWMVPHTHAFSCKSRYDKQTSITSQSPASELTFFFVAFLFVLLFCFLGPCQTCMKTLTGPKRILRKHWTMSGSMCSKISSLLVLPPIVWNTIWKSCAREERKDIGYVSQICGDSSLKPCYMKRYNSSTFLFRFEYSVNIAVRTDSRLEGVCEGCLVQQPCSSRARAGCPEPWASEYLRSWRLHSFPVQHMQCLITLTENRLFCLFACFSDRHLNHVPW